MKPLVFLKKCNASLHQRRLAEAFIDQRRSIYPFPADLDCVHHRTMWWKLLSNPPLCLTPRALWTTSNRKG